MDNPKGANPKLLLAVQMLLIGLVLVILGLTVFWLSPLSQMEPFMRKMSWLSDLSIILVGLAFTIGGLVKYRKVKLEINKT
jgi:hypothetical protein